MNNLGAEALDFSELFPFLKLEDAAGLDSAGLDELPDEHMMELLQTLSNELEAEEEEEADAKEQLAQETKSDDQAAPARAGSVDGSSRPTEEAGAEGDKGQPMSTRVRTYTARKMEIARLMKELPDLEGYVEFLKHQAAKAHNQTDSLQKTRLINSSLRESVHRQQYTLARLQSAMTLYRTRQERMVPMDTIIQLPRDMDKRLHVVASLRKRILRDALRFMRERTWFVDYSVPSTENGSFLCGSEACCVERFCVFPIHGPANVKQVYDALLFFIPRTDVMINESTGDATSREDASDLTPAGAVQSRQTRTVPSGLTTETNVITFADFQAQDEDFGGGRALGVIVVNTVGKDELYPYSPQTRLRYDITSAIVVKTYALNNRKATGEEDAGAKDKRRGSHSRSRFGVVMTRHSFVKLHRGDTPISSRELRETCDRLVYEGNLLFDTVQASVESPITTTETDEP